MTGEEDDMFTSKGSASKPIVISTPTTTTSTTTSPTRSTPTAKQKSENKTEEITTTEVTEMESAAKPQPRLLNLNVDELQTFANALHNQSHQNENKKPLPDLSDVNLDGDEDEEPKMPTESKHKQITDKFYSNLQAPFHPLLGVDRSSEIEVCKENEVTYKVSLKNRIFNS